MGLIKSFGVPRLIITLFFVLLFIIAGFSGLPIDMIISDILNRVGMNGVLVLAMVFGICCGIGLNFGVSLGILSGIVGGLISIELNLSGGAGFFVAILFGVLIACGVGALYGTLLNGVKGSEMTVSTYAGFSAVALMCMGWLLLPFMSPVLKWPLGKGLRNTIEMSGSFGKILNNTLSFNIGKVFVPTGLLLFLAFVCLLAFLFLRSKTGIAMVSAGTNPIFATASGINVNKMRMLGTMLSTVCGAVGIIVYAQSYGFMQLYTAPMMMSFSAVAAILIGGASVRRASISHVLIGVFLFQGVMTLGMPVANKLIPGGNLSEVMRNIISNGIILYALTKAKGGADHA